MAQAGYTPIQLYLSTTASAVPSAGNLANGELAINITDGKLFYKDNGGVVQVLATKGAGTIGGSNTQVQYNSSGALAGSANLTFDGTTLTAAGLAGPLNGTVGGTTPNTGAFTTLAASGTVTLSGGTANGVPYLNVSKVLTTGIALTFDGTTLTSSAFSGSGAALTSLNASNLASGTVATARLASGTANSTTYLRGDQTWASIPSGTPGGSNTQVQYNNSGSFGGSANLTFDGTTLTSSAFSGSGAALTSLNASNLASGTVATARLGDSGVTAGSYGSASAVPVVTVDAKGRVTAASTVAVAAGGGFSNMVVFTTSGTWTVPGGVTKAKITVVGGGGNGGNATADVCSAAFGGPGAGGGCAIGVYTVSGSYTVTVGGAGGTSSVGALLSATGGASGASASPSQAQPGVTGGVGSGGNINIQGQNSYITGNSGIGGNSFLGFGQSVISLFGNSQNGQPGRGYGGGASGAIAYAGGGTRTGGAGTSGVVIIEY